MAGRSRRGERADSAKGARRPGRSPGGHPLSRSPGEHIPSRWERSGRRGADGARSIACSRREARPGRGLGNRAGSGTPEQATQKPQQLLPELLEARRCRRRLQMDDEVQGRQVAASAPSPIYLSDPSLQPLADHGATDLAGGRDPEARVLELIGNEVQGGQEPVLPASRPVAPLVIRPAPQGVLPGEALSRPSAGGRPLLAVWPQTLRRLRPFLRRRDSTARPWLVRMRKRKPCFFLRLRLLG